MLLNTPLCLRLRWPPCVSILLLSSWCCMTARVAEGLDGSSTSGQRVRNQEGSSAGRQRTRYLEGQGGGRLAAWRRFKASSSGSQQQQCSWIDNLGTMICYIYRVLLLLLLLLLVHVHVHVLR